MYNVVDEGYVPNGSENGIYVLEVLMQKSCNTNFIPASQSNELPSTHQVIATTTNYDFPGPAQAVLLVPNNNSGINNTTQSMARDDKHEPSTASSLRLQHLTHKKNPAAIIKQLRLFINDDEILRSQGRFRF